MKVPCLCIDAKNRPQEIPLNKWISEGIQYTILHIGTTVNRKILTCTLLEVTLDETCKPYDGYRLDRFAFKEEDIPKLLELMKSCSELNGLNINELLEESQLEILKLTL